MKSLILPRIMRHVIPKLVFGIHKSHIKNLFYRKFRGVSINVVFSLCKSMVERITIDPAICHGKPCVRCMRWPVEVILDLLESGMSVDEIIKEHPELENDDILASINYARLYLSDVSLKDVA